ncbi:hypothetical protein ACFLU8_00305 [Chloroflexota bacterium]
MKRARVTQEIAYGAALDRLTGTDKPASVPNKEETDQQISSPMIKLSVFLGSGEDAYLETLASTAKFSGGKKLSKTKIVEAMVRAFRTSKLDVRGVKIDEELLERLIAQLRQ